MLMHYFPEVTAAEALEDEEGEDGGEEQEPAATKQKSYEERMAQAGFRFQTD